MRAGHIDIEWVFHKDPLLAGKPMAIPGIYCAPHRGGSFSLVTALLAPCLPVSVFPMHFAQELGVIPMLFDEAMYNNPLLSALQLRHWGPHLMNLYGTTPDDFVVAELNLAIDMSGKVQEVLLGSVFLKKVKLELDGYSKLNKLTILEWPMGPEDDPPEP